MKRQKKSFQCIKQMGKLNTYYNYKRKKITCINKSLCIFIHIKVLFIEEKKYFTKTIPNKSYKYLKC